MKKEDFGLTMDALHARPTCPFCGCMGQWSFGKGIEQYGVLELRCNRCGWLAFFDRTIVEKNLAAIRGEKHEAEEPY